MEKNRTGHIGLLSTVIIASLMLAIAIRMTVLFADKNTSEIRYLDPTLSTNLVRGTIYDRNGEILAIQSPIYGFIVRSSSPRAAYLSSVISPYIRISPVEAEEIIRSGKGFIELKAIPDMIEESTIEKLLSALDAEDEIKYAVIEKRVYAASTDCLIGQTDSELNGISGLEEYADEILSAKPVLGFSTSYGSDIITTIDSSLQSAVEGIESLDSAEDGIKAAILTENGEILAWHGKGSDELYQNLILRISNRSNTFPYFPTFPTEAIKYGSEAAGEDGIYLIYAEASDEKEEEAIRESLLQILISQGRIRALS